MSSTVATARTPGPGVTGHALAADAAPGLYRLTAVELRKMVDTRAGLWLQIGAVAITVIVVIITCATGNASQHTFRHIFSNSLQPSAIMLPVVGVLLMTSEWSQRTALTTFTLVPQRSRVFVAKVLAAVVLAVPTLVVCLLVSVIGAALASAGAHGHWTIAGGMFGQAYLYLATALVTGVAFGAALLAPVQALASYLALPTAISALTSVVGKDGFLGWIDNATTLSPMTEHLLSGTQWGRVGTTLLAWMLLPLAIGLWRVLRSEIK